MTHARIHLRPSYTSCRISGSIHTTCLVTWQHCCATDVNESATELFLPLRQECGTSCRQN